MADISVMHHIPGRLRVRLPAEVSGRRIEQRLLQHAGVKAVRRSRRARSLVIEYEPSQTDASGILEVLASVLGLPPEAISDPDRKTSTPLSRAFVHAVRRLDRRVVNLTNHHVDLQSLLALSLVAWALRQILGGRARELPWSTALWYAYELFRHHAQRAPRTGGISDPPESL